VVFCVVPVFEVISFRPDGNSMRISLLWVLLFVVALPAYAVEQLTVAQLEQKLAAQQPPSADKPTQALRDLQLSQLVGNFTLTERLSDPRLNRIVQVDSCLNVAVHLATKERPGCAGISKPSSTLTRR